MPFNWRVMAASMPGVPSWSIVIASAASETDTSATPGTRRTALATLATQAGQSMPSTPYRASTIVMCSTS